MSSSDSDIDLDKPNFKNKLPPKSQVKYLQAYETFMNWKKQNQKNRELDESIFMDYFIKLSHEKKPSSLWSVYSMLKCTVYIKHKINIQNYVNLVRFLKEESKGYKSVTTRILTEENINKFIEDAPDDIYLATKVGLILGVSGACRSGELCKMTTKNINKQGEVLVVSIRDSLHNTDRVFVIGEEFASVVQKYQALRPKNVETDRFFLKYRNGKCVRQVIGISKISSMPKEIAAFLKLSNPNCYTGHCFRKSSAGSGVSAITGKKRRIKLGTDPEDALNSSVDAQTGKQEIEEANKKIQKQETVIDYGETTVEYNSDNQDIQVEIEDNPNSSAKSLRHVRVSRTLAASREPELDMECDDEQDALGEDPIHVKIENVDEIGNLSPQGDLWATSQPSASDKKVHVSSDENHTNIRVAGKNINIIFKNCAHVGNITINIVKDE